jgi:hypothetical protein
LYVVLNPVAAGVCSHPREWPWRSYSATADGDPDSYRPGEERLLRMFGSTPAEARRRYAAVVDDAVSRIAAQPVPDARALWSRLDDVVLEQVSD